LVDLETVGAGVTAEHGMFGDYPSNSQPLHHRKSATNAPCSTARRLQMAPNLPASQHALIKHMLDDGCFTNH
jgi:hypothetical protein